MEMLGYKAMYMLGCRALGYRAIYSYAYIGVIYNGLISCRHLMHYRTNSAGPFACDH